MNECTMPGSLPLHRSCGSDVLLAPVAQPRFQQKYLSQELTRGSVIAVTHRCERFPNRMVGRSLALALAYPRGKNLGNGLSCFESF